jgi:hypothetical protein
MRIFGINSVDVSASSTAGFGVLAVDTVMAIDASSSMSTGSNCPNGASCPIVAAKSAAHTFTDTLLSGSTASSDTLVGETPYRGCFNLPNLFSICVPLATMMQPLSNSKTTVDAKISAIATGAGSGTNVCNGIYEANQVLTGTGAHHVSNMLKIIVLLTDGDNVYVADANGVPTPQSGRTPTPIAGYALPGACKPSTTPFQSDSCVSASCGCHAAQTREVQVDSKTKQLADTLRSQGVEIYVVGLGVCNHSSTGDPNPTQYKTDSYCAGIGNGDHDNTADRRLLKCIASSSPGTNDHYFEAVDASQLPNIFTTIARLIGFRLIK